MTERAEKEISCMNCQAACCQGGTMELSLEEASFMLRGGNRLDTIAQPVNHDREEVFCPGVALADPDNPNRVKMLGTMQPLPAGFGRYFMRGTCKYLEVSEEGWQYCSAYEQRPASCQRFEVGGSQCQILRQVYGVDEESDELRALRDTIEVTFTRTS